MHKKKQKHYIHWNSKFCPVAFVDIQLAIHRNHWKPTSSFYKCSACSALSSSRTFWKPLVCSATNIFIWRIAASASTVCSTNILRVASPSTPCNLWVPARACCTCIAALAAGSCHFWHHNLRVPKTSCPFQQGCKVFSRTVTSVFKDQIWPVDRWSRIVSVPTDLPL